MDGWMERQHSNKVDTGGEDPSDVTFMQVNLLIQSELKEMQKLG